MSSSVEQIKAKLSIVDVVGSYLKLEKAGVNYRARCPFHNEKSPSFFVSPTRGSYHCFGCQAGGDIFSFVEAIEGMDFIGALKILAEKAGVELEAVHRVDANKNQRLFLLLDESAKFYFKQLTQTPDALRYFYDRGLTKETIKNWRLGFAPAGWRNLSDFLRARGYREDEMIRAGVVVAQADNNRQKQNGYDRFRSRLMFPLANPVGKIVGFSGRIFGSDQNDTAKYINSPQTELYDKSKILYGYAQAKQAMRQKDFCVFVEGQMDLLMSHQAGLTNTVAVSGTALTADHVRLVKRLTENIILAYDYDLAGLSASRKAIDLLREEGLNVKIAKLPSGQDPAEVIKSDPNVWLKSVAEAKHYIDFMIDALQEEGKTGLSLNLSVNMHVLPYIKGLGKKMEQAHFVAKLANLLAIGEEAIWQDLQKIKLDLAGPVASTETTLIRTRSQIIEERLFGLYFWQVATTHTTTFDEQLSTLLSEEIFAKKKAEYEPLRDKLALSAELLYDSINDWSAELVDLATRWRIEKLKEELRRVLLALSTAERSGDNQEVARQLQICQDLNLAINNFKK